MVSFRKLPARGRIGTAVASIGVATLLTACSSGEAAPSLVDGAGQGVVGEVCCIAPPGGGAGTVNGISTEYNGWDTYLISWITPHDAVASQMAALAPAQADSPAVKELAATIDADTSSRYLRVSEMATAWGQPVPSTDPASVSGHNHSAGSSEAATVETLVPLSGQEFDRAFLTIMIEHHQAVVPVAQNAIAEGVNPQDREFAQEILDSQSAEINVMQEISRTL